MALPPDTTQQIYGTRAQPLWKNVHFLILFSGQAISSTGTQITEVTLPLMLLQLTHSPAQAGLIAACSSVALILFGLPAGALVDRWNRKYVMIGSDTLRMLAIASIAIALMLHRISFIQIALVAFCDGTLSLFFSLAESSALPQVVTEQQLPDAISLDKTLDSTSTMVGPALGPLLYGIGQSIPFLADAISTAISVISLLFVRTQFQAERIMTKQTRIWHDVWDGLTWLWQHSMLRFLALLTFGLITPCYGYLFILYLQAQRFHATNAEISLIIGCSGAGSFIGSLCAGRLYKRFGVANMILWSTWIWAITWLCYALAWNTFSLAVINALCFIVVPIYMIVQYSCRLTLTPDHLRGRVNAAFRLIAFGSQSLSMALTGLLLQLWGPIITVVLLFIPQFAMASAVLFQWKRLRSLEEQQAQEDK